MKKKLILYSNEAVAQRTNRVRRTISQIANSDPDIGIEVIGGEGKTKSSWVFTQAHIDLILKRYGEIPKAGRPKRDREGSLIESPKPAPEEPKE